MNSITVWHNSDMRSMVWCAVSFVKWIEIEFECCQQTLDIKKVDYLEWWFTSFQPIRVRVWLHVLRVRQSAVNQLRHWGAIYTTLFSTKNGTKNSFMRFGHSFTRQLHLGGLKTQTFGNFFLNCKLLKMLPFQMWICKNGVAMCMCITCSV